MSTFTIDLQAFADKMGDRMDQVVRKVSADVFRSVVKRSPVDSGRFRGAWTVNTNELVDSPGAILDKDGNLTISRANLVIQKINGGDTVVISNKTPYGPILEFGGYPNPPKDDTGKTRGGYSIQAPHGMVGLTVAEFTRFLRKAAAEVNK